MFSLLLVITILSLPLSTTAPPPPTRPPSQCISLTVSACQATTIANFVNGQFVPYLGSCNGADTDYTVWYNQNKNMYLYHKNDQW